MKLIIDISEEYYKAITEIPNHQCTADMLIIKYGTPLENKTNGDIIKSLFNVVEVKPHKEFTYGMSVPVEKIHHLDITIQHENILSGYLVPKKWWDSRYKEINNETND